MSSLDHSGHQMPMPKPGGHTCKMNMLFTWDTTDLCVVFRWWHISSSLSLLLTLIAVAALAALYELLRVTVACLDERDALNLSNHDLRIQKAIGYAAQVGYSYMLMLVFMTYNGWIMVALVVGAAIGHYLWGKKAAREMSCH